MFDKYINWVLICLLVFGWFICVVCLPGCGTLDTAAKATKGVVRIYKEAESKVDDLHKYCVEVREFLSICRELPECSRMITRHEHFCDSADKFLKEIQEVKDEILSEVE